MKKSSRSVQRLGRTGWVRPFASKLTTATERDMHGVVFDTVHVVRIPTSSPASTAKTEPGRILLQILHAGRYAYHPLAISANATRSPISLFAAGALSTEGVRATLRDFVYCAVLARDAGYDGVEITGSEGHLINQFLVVQTNQKNNEYGGDRFAN